VTVKLNALPAVADAGAETAKCVAAPAATTVIVFDVPVIEAFPVSVAVMACGPAVFSVAENVPVPLVNVEFAGNTAAPSLLVK
jgi:hypothetical protein